MNQVSAYMDLIRVKGMSLSVINPGSEEVALSIDDALKAVKLLEGTGLYIYGGDIMTIGDKGLAYANVDWGSEYHSLDWFYEPVKDKTRIENATLSYNAARVAIDKASKVASSLEKECLIVLVVFG